MKHYILAAAALALSLGVSAPQPAQAEAAACIGCNCKIRPPGCADPTDAKGNSLKAMAIQNANNTSGVAGAVSRVDKVNALNATAAAGYEPPAGSPDNKDGALSARIGTSFTDGNHNKSEIWGLVAAGKVDYSDPKSFGYADRAAMQEDVSKIAGFIAARQEIAAKLAANPRYDYRQAAPRYDRLGFASASEFDRWSERIRADIIAP